MFCFEVITIYKSGKKKDEFIIASDEHNLWGIYDEHHSKNKVNKRWIANAWYY